MMNKIKTISDKDLENVFINAPEDYIVLGVYIAIKNKGSNELKYYGEHNHTSEVWHKRITNAIICDDKPSVKYVFEDIENKVDIELDEYMPWHIFQSIKDISQIEIVLIPVYIKGSDDYTVAFSMES